MERQAKGRGGLCYPRNVGLGWYRGNGGVVDSFRHHHSSDGPSHRLWELPERRCEDTVLLVPKHGGLQVVGRSQEGLHTGARAAHRGFARIEGKYRDLRLLCYANQEQSDARTLTILTTWEKPFT